MKTTESAGGVVVNGELVIVVNQRGRSWSLPKGHVEKGETYIEAARREIYEESGVKDLELVRGLGAYQRYRMGKYPEQEEDKSNLKIIHMYLFRTGQRELKPMDPDNPEARWVPKREVAGLLTHPKDKEFFMSIIEEI